MKKSAIKVLALCGLCALFAGAGTASFAQGYDHQDRNNDPGQYSQNDHHFDDGHNDHGQYGQNRYDHGQYGQDSQYRQSGQYRHASQTERRRLDRLHAAYARAATQGHYNAAERDHLHAQAIRARLRSQHDDNNQYRDNNQHDDSNH